MNNPRPIGAQSAGSQSGAGCGIAGCVVVGAAFVLVVLGAAGALFFLRTADRSIDPPPMSPPVPVSAPAPAPISPVPAMPVPAMPVPAMPAPPTAPGDPLAGEPAATPSVEPTPAMGEPTVRGSLSREVIRGVIRRHIAEVQRCYETGLATNPTLAGRIVVQFIISASGAVTTASVGESDLHDAAVERCVVSSVRSWTFPAPDGGGIVAVNYPFVFASSP